MKGSDFKLQYLGECVGVRFVFYILGIIVRNIKLFLWYSPLPDKILPNLSYVFHFNLFRVY